MKIAGFYSATLKNSINMATLQHYAKWVINIILGIGCFLVFNENEYDITPNFIGLACAALLIVINRDKK